MTYLIYGKCVESFTTATGKKMPVHQKFAALNYKGVRCAKKADADDYATREDAQEVINKAKENLGKYADNIVFEIRPA